MRSVYICLAYYIQKVNIKLKSPWSPSADQYYSPLSRACSHTPNNKTFLSLSTQSHTLLYSPPGAWSIHSPCPSYVRSSQREFPSVPPKAPVDHGALHVDKFQNGGANIGIVVVHFVEFSGLEYEDGVSIFGFDVPPFFGRKLQICHWLNYVPVWCILPTEYGGDKSGWI